MAEARIEVTCPGCEKPFHIPPSEQGNVRECPHCGGWVDVPELGRPPTTAEIDDAMAQRTAREFERQQQESARQLIEAARQQEVWERQLAEAALQIGQAQRGLDKREEQDARFDRLLDRMEAVIGSWEQLADRMGRVLDRMG